LNLALEVPTPVKELLKIIASDENGRLPVDAHASRVVLVAEFQALVGSLEKRIMVLCGHFKAAQRVEVASANICLFRYRATLLTCPRQLDRGGPGCLNIFSASISEASAGVEPPCGGAAG
jgi:hypothetical protein